MPLCVGGSSLSFEHVWLNNKDTFCQYNFIKVCLCFLISVLVTGWNWWMNLPKLSQALSDNFGRFIHQFLPETETLIRKLERILIKLYRQIVSLLSNQAYLNERLLSNYTYTHTRIYIYIYIYIYRGVCVKAWNELDRINVEKCNEKNKWCSLMICLLFVLFIFMPTHFDFKILNTKTFN